MMIPEDNGKKTDWFRLASLAINFCLLILVVLLLQQNRTLREHLDGKNQGLDESKFDILRPGDSVSAFTGTTLEGTAAEVLPGDSLKSMLLLIFKTTCAVCGENFENWKTLEAYNTTTSVRYISTQDIETALPYVKEKNLSSQALSVTDKNFIRAYKIHAVPYTVLLGADGNVLRAYVGLLTAEKMDTLKTLLTRETGQHQIHSERR